MSDAQAASKSRTSSNAIAGPSNGGPSTEAMPPISGLSAEHLRLKMRLAPLLHIEEVLLRRLNPYGTTHSEATYLTSMTNVPYTERLRRGSKEVSVNSTSPWKGAFTRLLPGGRQNDDGEADIDWNDPNDPGVVLNACAEDMMRLWDDPVVKRLLAVRKLRLEEMPGL